jgi:hypothetical protein
MPTNCGQLTNSRLDWPIPTGIKEGRLALDIHRKLQHGLTATEEWCERWNVKINEDKTQAIYFSHGNRPVVSQLTLKGRNIPFVNNVKYLGLNFDRKISWRHHIERVEAKAFRTFMNTYSLFKSERLSANIKLTLYKALIRSIMTYACPAWEFGNF